MSLRDELHRQVVAALGEAVVVLDAQGLAVACNPAAERMLGLRAQDVVGRRPPFEPVACEDGTPLTRPDGTRVLAAVDLHPLRDAAGVEHGVVWSARDVTRRRAAEARLRAVVGSAPMILFALDRDGRFTLSIGGGLTALGLRPGHLDGRRVEEVCADMPEILRDCRRALAGERFTSIVDLGRMVFETTYDPVLDARGAAASVIGVSTDITARRRSEEQVAHLAFHDALTGLPNRPKLEDHLAPALARARRDGRTAALLYLDLDDFKAVNDSLGHAAGDELLRQVARRLQSRVRAGDLLARQGGDEFLVLLADAGHDPAAVAGSVAHDLLGTLEAPFAVEGSEVHVGACVGIGLFPADGEAPAELLKRADAAMYQAKRSGSSAIALYAPGRDDAHSRLSIGVRLRRALARDELSLHFQPVVDLRESRPIAVEALLRWQDPVEGLVLPGAFVPVAEQTGLIGALGDWVAEAVCEQVRDWRAQGLDVRVTFNVSPHQLRDSRFARRLSAQVARTGIDPSRLTVELTESAAMADPARTDPVLGLLRELGVQLAIDDFGARFSSLARLRELPVDVLKIDRAFLRPIPGDAGAAALFGGIMALARGMRLYAVAEGVETDAQRDFLLAHGCPLAQGFALAPPMPADAVTALLAERFVAPGDRAWRPAGATRG